MIINMKKINSILMVAVTLFILSAGLITSPSVAQAALFDNSTKQACDGLTGGDGCGSTDPDDPTSASGKINKVISTVIDLLSIVVGVISVIMIIIGGIKYVVSQGDSNSVNSAKNTILYAIVGLVIVALAQVIVKFVLKRV